MLEDLVDRIGAHDVHAKLDCKATLGPLSAAEHEEKKGGNIDEIIGILLFSKPTIWAQH